MLWKHLHGRGEDEASSSEKPKNWETPPRTWRRLLHQVGIAPGVRNTSTDVEKTYLPAAGCPSSRKHLHGRGEDPVQVLTGLEARGNTSTDVEKTHSASSHHGTIRKHLHGRGEDRSPRRHLSPSSETPPRTWRRPGQRTCRSSPAWKHLHGRGEDFLIQVVCALEPETPPRTWRRLHLIERQLMRDRNTSTDVEKTCSTSGRSVLRKKHLHGRGEDS